MADLPSRFVDFGRALRAAGVPVDTSRLLGFYRAAALLPPFDLYWAGRATLVWRAAHLPLYDETFRRFFTDDGPRTTAPEEPEEEEPQARAVALSSSADEDDEVDTGTQQGSAGLLEVLGDKSFADCDPAELAQLATLMRDLQLVTPLRPRRRHWPAGSGVLDLRRTTRRALPTGGDPVRLYHRRRTREPRRLVFLLDISGSMADFSRALLLFAYSAHQARRTTEVWSFGTAVTRLTPVLAAGDPSAVLAAVSTAAPDWDGGTRIGESLRTLMTDSQVRSKLRGSVVTICSDGLEVGDVELLRGQMRRLSLLAHGVLWLNPLKADPRYQPLAEGMAASLPHVRAFRSGHNLASLRAAVADLATL